MKMMMMMSSDVRSARDLIINNTKDSVNGAVRMEQPFEQPGHLIRSSRVLSLTDSSVWISVLSPKGARSRKDAGAF